MVAVRVRIDDRRHGLVGDGLDFVQDDLAPSGQLGIDNHHAVIRDEHPGVTAAERVAIRRIGTGDHVQIVFYFFDLGGSPRRGRQALRRLLISGRRYRKNAGCHERNQYG